VSDTIPVFPAAKDAIEAIRGGATIPTFPAVDEAVGIIKKTSTFEELSVQPWEHDQLVRGLDGIEDPETELWKRATALQYSRKLNKPYDETYQNLDAYNLAFLGEAMAPKTAIKHLLIHSLLEI
jgi:hypothetical protein